MGTREIKDFVQLGENTPTMLRHAMADVTLSARSYDRSLKVSRTVADLAGRDNITREDVFEPVQYRTLDRQLWG